MQRISNVFLLFFVLSTTALWANTPADSTGSVRRWRVKATMAPVKDAAMAANISVAKGESLVMFSVPEPENESLQTDDVGGSKIDLELDDHEQHQKSENNEILNVAANSGNSKRGWKASLKPPQDEIALTGEKEVVLSRVNEKTIDNPLLQIKKTSDPDGIIAFAMEEENRLPITTALANPRLEVNKQKRILYVYDGEKLVRRYKVNLGRSPELPKRQFKDGLTPEGEYLITGKSTKSKYHKNLAIGYPNLLDATWGLENDLISQKEFQRIKMALEIGETPPAKTKLGGAIYIHGEGRTNGDWTEGCVALKNEDVDELFRIIPIGTPIQLYWK